MKNCRGRQWNPFCAHALWLEADTSAPVTKRTFEQWLQGTQLQSAWQRGVIRLHILQGAGQVHALMLLDYSWNQI